MDDLNSKAKRGIGVQIVRQFLIQGVNAVGGVLMARMLGPAEFGLYAVATFVVSATAMLGDFGLAPSFIQRREELTDRDLQIGFTLQQVLITGVVITLWFAAPYLVELYPDPLPETVWLIRALSFGLYLTAWRAMSAIQLERHLQFGPMARADLAETVSFQVIAVGLVLSGYGVWSFVWATLIRGGLGAFLLYLVAPWPVRFAWDWSAVRSILRYGVPFQFQSLCNSLGNWAVPTFVASAVGVQAVGYLTWSFGQGKRPLMLVDAVARVAYPHFSRAQGDRGLVEYLISRYLTVLLLVAGWWFVLLLTTGAPAVELVFTAKWLPAVPALVLVALAVAPDMASWLLSVSLNATGGLGYVTRLVLIRSLIVFPLSIAFAHLFGFNGAAIAYLLASALMVPYCLLGFGRSFARRISLDMVWVLVPVLAAIAAGFGVQGVASGLWARTIGGTLAVTFAYAIAAYVSCPDWVRKQIRSVLLSRRFARQVGTSGSQEEMIAKNDAGG
ncbi:oligosaccharide flippase family protein [Gemmata sp. JC717]|uniref:oligosaccharide flippase family protein n=1 Tax=Gemmata algarum TaxID=2975278 RepID=UPI0021BB0A76|nr:oligosaccharide flippase family protein [Gemmata algarum]MDY3552146.1 oligosaccharide flippase family protein [Gemmata algarum]